MQFIFQFGEFTGEEGGKFLDYMFQFLSVFVAVVAIVSSLYIFRRTLENQKRSDEDKKTELENNKLIYLDFLINDTRKVIVRYNDSANRLLATFNNNPFILSDMPHYPDHSIDAIANKINQEGYYLACLNRLKPDNIGELFLLYNSLYTTNKQTIDHHIQEFQPRIDSKEKVSDSLVALERLVRQYINEMPPDDSHPALAALTGFMNSLRLDEDFHTGLYQSLNGFILPIIRIIQQNGAPADLQDILHQAYEAKSAYLDCQSHMKNVVDFLISRQGEINYLWDRIQRVSQPLDEYLKRLGHQPVELVDKRDEEITDQPTSTEPP